MFTFFALTAASTATCIEMFMGGAVASLTLITTGSKVKKHYKSSKK